MNADKTFTVTIKIADKQYRLKIKQEEEKSLRKVESQLAEMLDSLRASYNLTNINDVLAMALIEKAVRCNELEEKADYEDNGLIKDIEAVNNLIDEHLHNKNV